MKIKKSLLLISLLPLMLTTTQGQANFWHWLKNGVTNYVNNYVHNVKQAGIDILDTTASCFYASCQGFSHAGQKTEHLIVSIYVRNYSNDNVSIALQKLSGNVTLIGDKLSLSAGTSLSPSSISGAQYKGGRNMFIARQDVLSYTGKVVVTGQYTACTADITIKLNSNGASLGDGGAYMYTVSNQPGSNCIINKSGEMNHGVTLPGASALVPNIFGTQISGNARATFNLRVPLFIAITPSVVN